MGSQLEKNIKHTEEVSARNFSDPLWEVMLYHGNVKDRGFVSLLRPLNGYPKLRQISYTLNALSAGIAKQDLTKNCYISQNQFWSWKRNITTLKRLTMVFLDLEIYHEKNPLFDINEVSPEQAAQLFIYFLKDYEGANLPLPTLINFSGRGLHVKWIFKEPQSKYPLPRWQAMQDQLIAIAQKGQWRVDTGVKDAARVLRMVGSVNQKNGQVCRTVFYEPQNYYDFETLCEWILPFTRQQLAEKKEHNQAEKAKREARQQAQAKSEDKTIWKPWTGFTQASLNYARFCDMQVLCERRGGFKEGMRMYAFFYMLNFLVGSRLVKTENFYDEAESIRRNHFAKWNYDKSELSSLFKRAEQFNNGEVIEFDNKKVTPLYRITNNNLIQLFEITQHEMKHLRTIINEDEKKLRRKVIEVERRCQKGMKPQSNSLSRKKPWETLGVSRSTFFRKKYHNIDWEKVEGDFDEERLKNLLVINM